MIKSGLKIIIGMIVYLVFLTSGVVQSQTYKSVPKISIIKILGTSSVHDWVSTTDQINGDMILTSNEKQIQSLIVKVPVKSIKSGKGLMDSKTYDAFESDKNPLITFQMIDASSFKISDKNIEAIINGNINMAGNTKKIIIKSNGKILADGSFQFKGSIPLKISEFKMKSPTAMMGMLKTGDAVIINFDVTFKSINSNHN